MLFARQKWSITCIYPGQAFITRPIELNVEMNSRNLSHHVRPFYVPQIYLFTLLAGGSRVNSKQLAGHLNGDQICPEARKLLRQQGKEGRKGSGFLVALQCKYLFRARASSLGLWPGKQSRSVACVMRPVAYA